MAGFSTTLRTSRATAINTAIGNAGILRIYSGTRPATGGTATTVLAELTCGSPFGTVSSGVLTAGAITADASANATGTASWARILTSTNTPVIDLSVTASGGGGEVQLSSTSIVAAGNVSISLLTITEGNQ